MKWKISEIEHQKSIPFDLELNLKSDLLIRNPEILDISQVGVVGSLSFDHGFYDLSFKANYIITLPSTRSLTPVNLPMAIEVTEVYVTKEYASSHIEEVDENHVFILDIDEISLSDAVSDAILLEVPMQVLTQEEVSQPAKLEGNDWQLLSEEEYDKQREDKIRTNSPFHRLDGQFD